MAKRDYYDVLGVQKTSSDQEIKKAYRKLAKKYHPDTNPGDKNAEKMFKEVTEAYNILSDKEKRKLYDRYGHAAFDGSMGDNPEDFAKNYGNGGHFYRSYDSGDGAGSRSQFYYNGNYSGNMDDMFEDMFGEFFNHGRNSGHFGSGMDFDFGEQKPTDTTSELTISFRDAALGCEKRISFEDRSLGSMDVKIPAGISEGQSIRLKGKGRNGDLLIKIHVRDDIIFRRKDRDVYITKSIPFATAALGGEVYVDTLYGAVKCKIPAGSQSGSKLRLKNKGIVSMKNKNQYGDEYVILRVEVPRNLTEREKALIRELQKIESRRSA